LVVFEAEALADDILGAPVDRRERIGMLLGGTRSLAVVEGLVYARSARAWDRAGSIAGEQRRRQ
jgi:hypothetical protein